VNDTDYKGFAYDAAWLVALALNRCAQELGPNFHLDTKPFGDRNFSDLMKQSLLSTEFLGVTVSVELKIRLAFQLTSCVNHKGIST